jgi:hypothetical protein
LRERVWAIEGIVGEVLRERGIGKRVSGGALEELEGYEWPGNVEELEGLVVRTGMLIGGEEIGRGDWEWGFKGREGGEGIGETGKGERGKREKGGEGIGETGKGENGGEGIGETGKREKGEEGKRERGGERLGEEGEGFEGVRGEGIGDVRGESVEVLLSTLVHEVKNPLVAISTFAHLLPERYGEEEFRGEFSRLVGLEVRRLNGVLEMLLEYNQLGTPLPVDVDLSKWVMNYCDEKGRCVLQKILVDLAPSSSPVRFDDRHLNFVFERIFDRIQTRGIAGGKVRILCQGLRQGENWGKLDIGYEEPEPLVQPSSRKGPSAEDQDFEGLSLGLGLARRIMRKNNGEMSLLREEEGIARILLLFGSQAPSRSES